MADFKTPLAFVGGLITGAATTWVVSAKYFNKKIDNQIQAIREDFEDAKLELRNESEMLSLELEDANREIMKLQSAVAGYSVKEEAEDEEMVVEKPKKATKKSKSMEELERKPEPEEVLAGKTDYTAYSKGNSKKEDPEIEVKVSSKKAKTAPYIITKADFASDDDHEKVLLTYFSNDNVFLDSSGDICGGNIATQIGKSNINFLVRESAETTMYVRNDENMVDYEVYLNEEPLCDDSEDEAEEED